MPYKGEILGGAVKATGKFKNQFIIEYKEPISMSDQWGHVNLDKVNDKVINGINAEEVMIRPQLAESAAIVQRTHC